MSWLSDMFYDSIDRMDEVASVPLRPTLRVVGQAPTREEFAAWQDHPISRLVFAGLERNAEECAEAWAEASWGQGTANQQLLTELRTRADALRSLVDAPYEAWCETLSLEPKNEE